MFENIEKEYKKNSKERKFNTFYWTYVFIIIVSACVLSKYSTTFDNIKNYVIYISTFIAIIIYFVIDYLHTVKNLKFNSKENILKKLKAYINYNSQIHTDNLVKSLSKYNYKSKADLKLAIDYFNSKRPIKVESSFIAWIVSIALTLSSFVELAYDNSTKTIDYNKLLAILSPTIGFIICFLIFCIFVKLMINSIILSKTEIQSRIVDDLSFIYLNFDTYKNKLTKK